MQLLEIQAVERAGATGNHRNGVTMNERCPSAENERTGGRGRGRGRAHRRPRTSAPAAEDERTGGRGRPHRPRTSAPAAENERPAAEDERAGGRARSAPGASASEPEVRSGRQRTGAVSCPPPAMRPCQAAVSERPEAAEHESTRAVSCRQRALRRCQPAENERTGVGRRARQRRLLLFPSSAARW